MFFNRIYRPSLSFSGSDLREEIGPRSPTHVKPSESKYTENPDPTEENDSGSASLAFSNSIDLFFFSWTKNAGSEMPGGAVLWTHR